VISARDRAVERGRPSGGDYRAGQLRAVYVQSKRQALHGSTVQPMPCRRNVILRAGLDVRHCRRLRGKYHLGDQGDICGGTAHRLLFQTCTQFEVLFQEQGHHLWSLYLPV
jgi:hypothetical protein